MNNGNKKTLLGLTIGLVSACCIAAAPSSKSTRTARAIYVAVGGNDSIGDGTEAHPFATLSKASEDLVAGDQVLIHGGRYLGTHVTIQSKGTETAPIRIAAVPGETVTLVGAGTSKGVDEGEDKAKIASVFDLRTARYVTVENLEVTDSPGYGISVWDAENVTVRGCKIHHTWSRGLGGSGDHLLFENNEIYDVVLQNEEESTFGDTANAIRYWSAAAATWYRPGGIPSRDIVWRKNKIYDSWGEGLIALLADGVRIEGNEVFNIYSGLIYIDHSRNVTVDSNFVYHSDRKRVRRDSKEVSSGIFIGSEGYRAAGAFEIENIRITRNVIVNVEIGIGYWRDGGNPLKNTYKNVLIENNLVYGAALLTVSFAAPTYVATGGNNRIAGNIFFEPRYLWRLNPEPITLRLDNPEIWSVDRNLILRAPSSEMTTKLASFTGNLIADPKLTEPRVSLPMNVENFRPRCDSPVWNVKGKSIGPWKNCKSSY